MTKFCNTCKQEKPIEAFSIHRKNRDGRNTRCKECNNKSSRAWHATHKEHIREYGRAYRIAHPENIRRLKRLYRQRHPGRASAQCKAAIRKKWDTKYHPERWRYWLKQKYGITEEQFDALVRKQKNKCAICKNGQRQGPRRPNLCVDHCHNSKRLRGLLCFQCNVMLGAAKDSIKTLRAAIRYLKEYEVGPCTNYVT